MAAEENEFTRVVLELDELRGRLLREHAREVACLQDEVDRLRGEVSAAKIERVRAVEARSTNSSPLPSRSPSSPAPLPSTPAGGVRAVRPEPGSMPLTPASEVRPIRPEFEPQPRARSPVAARSPDRSGFKTCDAERPSSTCRGRMASVLSLSAGFAPSLASFASHGSSPDASRDGSPASRRRSLQDRRRSQYTVIAAPKDTQRESGVGDGEEVRSVEEAFQGFCGKGPDMDGRTFAKLCRDCSLHDRKFTSTDADLVFSKVVTKGQRRLGLGEFLRALELVAEKKGITADAVCSAVTSCSGPVLSGTTADVVRFHDDLSTYTGTHVRGLEGGSARGSGFSTPSTSRRQ